MGEKKMVSDLERMNKDRRRAEEEYLENQQRMLEVKRIMRDGITNVDELLLYVADVVLSITHSEDLARVSNNSIVYSEAVGIRREMTKLLELVLKGRSAMEDIVSSEERHRTNNDGGESYV